MRGKEIPFIGNQLTVDELSCGPVVVVINPKQGKATLYKLPEYGEAVIQTQDNIAQRIRFTQTEKI